MLVTPYLISIATPESPRPLVEGATTSWFQVYLREFRSITDSERAEPLGRPAVESAAPTTADKESAIGR
jgi:hypothetical protein